MLADVPSRKPSAASTSDAVAASAARVRTSTPSMPSAFVPSSAASSSAWVAGEVVWCTTSSSAIRSDPVRVVAVHERGPLLRGHRVLGQMGECLEVLLARRAGSEQQQHRRGVALHVAEAVDAALRDVEVVAAAGVLPARAVV